LESQIFQTNFAWIIKTHFMFSNVSSENRVNYEITWKTMVQLDRPQMTTKYRACALHTV